MIARFLALASVVALAAVGVAADAHVRISPATVAAGSTATLTFRCPNERTATSTVKLAIELPPGLPLSAIAVPPVAGWHIVVSRRDGTVTWEGGSIPPGAAGVFTIVIRPIPAAGPLLFRAVQTYGNGEVVRWIQARAPGEPEPPFPAPVLTVR
jgi:uncharacterized protein YcnI